MGESTNISWTDASWNPWHGCTKISPGCANCYAETLVMRRMKGGAYRKGVPRVRHAAATFNAPLRWNKKPWVCSRCEETFPNGPVMLRDQKCFGCGETVHRRRVFSLSLGDWLDDEVPVEWLIDMLDVIQQCPNLDFLLLTKRPENLQARLWAARIQTPRHILDEWIHNRPPANVWFGFSAENQEQFDERWEHAQKIPAKQKFVSFEPLLGEIKLPKDFWPARTECRALPWGIIGGESGNKARACHAEWIDRLRLQFKASACPVFVKQMGGNVWSDTDDFYCPMSDLGKGDVKWKAHLDDPHGGDPAEWPESFRVRQWPENACVAGSDAVRL